MNHKNLFETFSNRGKLLLSDQNILFQDIPWSKHPEFEGVELKHILTAAQTGGQFSYHLVRIAPNKKIGNHIHTEQTETHEVIDSAGFCMNNQIKLPYEPGILSLLPAGLPHEVTTGADGLYLFAKFIPALT